MNVTGLAHRSQYGSLQRQRGVATLLVTLIILVILTVIVLSSSGVALFEQKTATNENRQRLAEQASEYAINLGGEYLKARITKISTNATGGWFDSAPTPTNVRWQKCPDVDPADLNHPCYAEPNSARRHKMYYYTGNGAADLVSTSTNLDLPYDSLAAGAAITNVGASKFPVVVKVRALLCLLDLPNPAITPQPATYPCETFALRTNGQRVAVTLIAESTMAGESARSIVKETWASYSDNFPFAAVPLIAAGQVQGLGNAMIVAAPNAGGIGLPGSIWSPQDVDVDSSGTGVGSVSTCHVGDYLGTVPFQELKTTCALNSDPCKCTISSSSNNFLSGHTTAVKREDIDVLDVDHWTDVAACATDGSETRVICTQPLPDIAFYPGRHCTSAGVCTRLDDAAVDTDDNLFEWIFNKDVSGGNGPGYPATAAMDAAELNVLDGYSAVHLANCSSLGPTSEGLYYIEGACDLPNTAVGSPTKSVILVVNDNAQVNGNTVLYGMLFVRDTTAAACTAGSFGSPTPPACLSGTGGKFFGAVVVEGDVRLAGSPQIVYVDSSTGTSKDPPPATTRFARVPGTWLDGRTGF
jgi:Tfp pilus assembly protein PilX